MDIREYYYWMLDAVLTLIGWHSLAGRSTQWSESVSAAWMLANVRVSAELFTCHLHLSANHTSLV